MTNSEKDLNLLKINLKSFLESNKPNSMKTIIVGTFWNQIILTYWKIIVESFWNENKQISISNYFANSDLTIPNQRLQNLTKGY
jgi:hypothetical protein